MDTNGNEPMHLNVEHASSKPGSCRRCGTCCIKGGPALHLDDQPLVASGRIELVNLYTIRQGEPVYDNVRGIVATAETDIVKIRSAAGKKACCFLEPDSRKCSIYNDRPQECRVLQCWDTRAITRLYSRERLTRAQLLSTIAGLWDLVDEHQRRCDYTKLALEAGRLKNSGEAGHADAAGAIEEMIRYDYSLRQLAVERAALDERLLLFLFGRPVAQLLNCYQLKLLRHDAEFIVTTV